MSGEMLTEPDQLAFAAADLDRHAETLGTELGALQATVTSGNPWGEDEAGSLFAIAYNAVLGHALDVLGSHVDQVAEAAAGLRQWAEAAASVEEENTRPFHDLAQTVGGGAPWG